MQIRQISVTGLFGIFDHVIPLNTDEHITIIHAPNGFGKTIILRMLNDFFKSRYSIFRSIPFSCFQIELDNGNIFNVMKVYDDSGNNFTLNFNFFEINSEARTFFLGNSRNIDDMEAILETIEGTIPAIRRLSPDLWRDMTTGEHLSSEKMIERFEDFLPIELRTKEEPLWLQELKQNIYIRLIESQRLLNGDITYSKSRSSTMVPTVSTYAKEIAQSIQSKLAEYGKTSQALDRTFPARVMNRKLSSALTDEQLRQQLDKLELIRTRLIEAGLLDKGDNSDFQIQDKQHIDDGTKNILSIYIEDVRIKLEIFSEISNKLDLLRRIINNKFAYSYKKMSFDKDKGFVFKAQYSQTLSSNIETILPTDLSSGEQYELVLLYELLFKVHPNSLVLIDEPELSLHVGWQAQFLKDLEEIAKLADLNILIATHSPDIIQDRWDLTVELKGLAT